MKNIFVFPLLFVLAAAPAPSRAFAADAAPADAQVLAQNDSGGAADNGGAQTGDQGTGAGTGQPAPAPAPSAQTAAQFQAFKATVLQRLDGRIAKLQAQHDCIQNAISREEIHHCQKLQSPQQQQQQQQQPQPQPGADNGGGN